MTTPNEPTVEEVLEEVRGCIEALSEEYGLQNWVELLLPSNALRAVLAIPEVNEATHANVNSWCRGHNAALAVVREAIEGEMK